MLLVYRGTVRSKVRDSAVCAVCAACAVCAVCAACVAYAVCAACAAWLRKGLVCRVWSTVVHRRETLN